MRRLMIVSVFLAALASAGQAQLKGLGPKPECKAGSRDFNECAMRLGDWQRRKKALEAQARYRNVDKEGRKILYIGVKGIRPEVEQKALPGDVIGEKANIRVWFKNEDSRSWSGNSGGRYEVKFDPATKHYSGWEELEMRLLSSKEQSEGEKKAKRKAVLRVEKITFDKPLRIRVWAETVLGNCFWTEFTAAVQGDAETGFTIPNEIYLDHYSRTDGKDDAPQTEPPPPPGAAKPAAPAPAVKPGPQAPPAQPAVPEKPKAAPVKEEREVTASELIGRFKGLKMKSTNPADHGFAVRDEIELLIKGFSKDLSARLSSDPVEVRKGSFKLKVYMKNSGEGKWANVKGETVKGAYDAGVFRDFDLRLTRKENIRMSLDKPVTVRVEAEGGAGLYWAEVERTKENAGEPIVIDNYTAR